MQQHSQGFPALTTKRVYWKTAFKEMLWMLQGNSKWGDLGPVYGKQWRAWKIEDGREIDQVSELIDLINNNPTSRRIIFDGWHKLPRNNDYIN